MIGGVARAPDRPRLPDGFVVMLDPTTQVLADGAVLLGGRPRRILRLHPSMRSALISGRLTVGDARTAVVGRRLLNSGLGHPWLPTSSGADFVTPTAALGATTAHDRDLDPPDLDRPDLDIVVPVGDRPRELARLLAAVRADPETARARVIVVDDGSDDPAETAEIARRAGADVVRHPVCRGPAAARNTGLASGSATTVAFLDSDCVPLPGWLCRLARHLQDPAVALAAPRVVAGTFAADRRRAAVDGTGTPIVAWLSSYEQVASTLDLGPHAGRVEPGLPVSYVPSVALLARRAALGEGFADAMAVAEDVDLVWRLVAAGWTVRYEPQAEVAHEHRTRAGAFLTRRAYYGTGAALLAQRHGDAVAPVVVQPWTAFAWLGFLIGRRWSLALSAVALGLATLRLGRALARAEVPAAYPAATDLVWRGSASAGRALLRPPGREYWPVAVATGLIWPPVRRRMLLAIALDGVLAWWPHRRRTPFWGFLAARRLEDIAYGTGVWLGVWRARSTAALRPRVQWPTAASPTVRPAHRVDQTRLQGGNDEHPRHNRQRRDRRGT